MRAQCFRLLSILFVTCVNGEVEWERETRALTRQNCSDPGGGDPRVIRVATLLPGAEVASQDPHSLAFYNRLEMVLPAIELAATGLYGSMVPGFPTLQDILPGWSLEVQGGDTQCSSTYGPLQAFDLHCSAGK